MDEGSLGAVTVVVAAGAAGMLFALLFGLAQLGRTRLSLPRPMRLRRRRRVVPQLPSAAAERLVLDVEGVVELVRTDRLRASARAEIEALTIAETLLDRAISRYRATSASTATPPTTAAGGRRAGGATRAEAAPAAN